MVRTRRLTLCFDIGDRVHAYEYGFYAEYVAVAAEDVDLVPKLLDTLARAVAET